MITYKRMGQEFELSTDNATNEEVMLLIQVQTANLRPEDRAEILEKAKNMTETEYNGLVQAIYHKTKKQKVSPAWFTFKLSDETDSAGNKILMKQNHLIKQKISNNLLYMDILLLVYGGCLVFKKLTTGYNYESFIETLKQMYVSNETSA
ncbi:MAG: hypothetical protein ACRCST_04560 [Turicibacter sp.]